MDDNNIIKIRPDRVTVHPLDKVPEDVNIFNMAYAKDFSFSMYKLNGKDGPEIDDNELFDVWVLIADKLSISENLDKNLKNIVTSTINEL